MRHSLTDEQWDFIKDVCPVPPATGRPPADPRKMFDAILWVNNTGAKWRDLPSESGAWQTVFRYFDRWNADGTLQAIVNRLTQFVISNGELDGELWCIDGTILRASQMRCRWCKKNDPEEPNDHALVVLAGASVIFKGLRNFTY